MKKERITTTKDIGDNVIKALSEVKTNLVIEKFSEKKGLTIVRGEIKIPTTEKTIITIEGVGDNAIKALSEVKTNLVIEKFSEKDEVKIPHEDRLDNAIKALIEAQEKIQKILSEKKEIKIKDYINNEYLDFIKKYVKESCNLTNHKQIDCLANIVQIEADKFLTQNINSESLTQKSIIQYVNSIADNYSLIGISFELFLPIFLPIFIYIVQSIQSKNAKRDIDQRLDNLEKTSNETKQLLEESVNCQP